MVLISILECSHVFICVRNFKQLNISHFVQHLISFRRFPIRFDISELISKMYFKEWIFYHISDSEIKGMTTKKMNKKSFLIFVEYSTRHSLPLVIVFFPLKKVLVIALKYLCLKPLMIPIWCCVFCKVQWTRREPLNFHQPIWYRNWIDLNCHQTNAVTTDSYSW